MELKVKLINKYTIDYYTIVTCDIYNDFCLQKLLIMQANLQHINMYMQ